MKLNVDQQRWFAQMRQEWIDRFQPGSSHMGRHLFDVAGSVPDEAVARACLFASRRTALGCLRRGGVVAEVGTQTGSFARIILDIVQPLQLHLFDLEFQTLATSSPDLLRDERVVLHEGDSSTNLETLADGSLDWIYIDGDHEIEGVRKDATVATRKIASDGILIFNDYMVWSPMEMCDYGVVPVVNGLLASGGWEVVYLALHPLMYCDVALQRKWTPLA